MKPLHLHFQLDFRSNVPIYVQISNQIQQLIASGTLKSGDQLPTVRQLATELRINFNTVARAYRMLDESGLISTQQGRGTYIWEDAGSENREQLRRKSMETLAENFLAEALKLGYSKEEIVKFIQDTTLDKRQL